MQRSSPGLVVAWLATLLLPACTNFGESRLPGHQPIWQHLDRELPPVTLPLGQTALATSHQGSGAPVPLWIYCEDPDLIRCELNQDRSVSLVPQKAGTATAFYVSGLDRQLPGCPEWRSADHGLRVASEPADQLQQIRAGLLDKQRWLRQYAYMLQPEFAGAGRENYERELARWQHVQALDIDHCADRVACNAWARGKAIARFQLTIAQPTR
jgi:hypothetical protein